MKKMMMTFLSALLVCSASQGFAQASSTMATHSSSSIHWSSSYAEALKQAQASSKPVLILFTGSTWCPACMQLEREILSRPEFAQAIGNKFVFYKIDLDPSEDMSQSPNKALFDRYGIQVFPTIIIADANGQKLRTVSYQSGGSVDSYVHQLLQK